jgi:hypothetical protein
VKRAGGPEPCADVWGEDPYDPAMVGYRTEKRSERSTMRGAMIWFGAFLWPEGWFPWEDDDPVSRWIERLERWARIPRASVLLRHRRLAGVRCRVVHLRPIRNIRSGEDLVETGLLARVARRSDFVGGLIGLLLCGALVATPSVFLWLGHGWGMADAIVYQIISVAIGVSALVLLLLPPPMSANALRLVLAFNLLAAAEWGT